MFGVCSVVFMRFVNCVFVFFCLSLLAGFSFAAQAELERAAVLSLNFTGGEIFFEDASFTYGGSPNAVSSGDFAVKVFQDNGSVSYSTSFKDPRQFHSELFYPNGSISGASFFDEKVRFSFVVPFDENTSLMEIFDANGTQVFSLYLSGLTLARSEFCFLKNGVCDIAFCGNSDTDCSASPSASPGSSVGPNGASASPSAIYASATPEASVGLDEQRNQPQQPAFLLLEIAGLIVLIALVLTFFNRSKGG